MANYPNWAGFFLSILGFLVLFIIKGNEPWRISNLLIGFILVLLASLSVGMFSDMNGLFDTLVKAQKIDEAAHKDAKTFIGIWVFVLPAVIGSIGANLITAWFLAKKPHGAG